MASGPNGEYVAVKGYRVVYGSGAVERLPELVDDLGGRRCFILTSPTLARVSRVPRQIEAALGPRYAGRFADVSQRCPIPKALAAAAAARAAEADVLISVGGSTVSDASRAITVALAVGLREIDELRKYHADAQQRGSMALGERWRPLQIFVPTTLSAAEFNTGGAILDPDEVRQLGFRGDDVVPSAIVLDGRVTLDTPEWLWLSSGMKALDHAIERLYSRSHNPLVDSTALRATELLFEHLPRCRRDPSNEAARLECLIAAWLSMHGMPNARLGLSHAIGHVVGQQCNIPHGLTTGISQPFAMEFNRPASADKQALFARAAGVDTAGLSDEAAAIAGARAVDRLFRDLGLPQSLRELDVPRELLPRLASLIVQDPNANTWNPIRLSALSQVLPVLEAAW